MLPFFHMPHITAAWLRATLRRALRGVSPSCMYLACWSAKGLSFVAIADLAAPRTAFLRMRLTSTGTNRAVGPEPLCRRFRPMPRYLHSAALLLKRHGVSI